MLLLGGVNFYLTKNVSKDLEEKAVKSLFINNEEAVAEDEESKVKFEGSYISFTHPESWKVEEDKEYAGYISIVRYDEEGRADIEYEIVRSKFERDSIKPSSSYLLLYQSLLENIVSEKSVIISGNLEGFGNELIVEVKNEEDFGTLVFNVFHLKMPKPISEYHDAIVFSGYHAETINGEAYFSESEKQDLQELVESIEIIY